MLTGFLYISLLIIILGTVSIMFLSPRKHFISYNGEIFTPQGITIKLGDIVSVKNNSQAEMEFAVGQHANHKTLKGYEERIIETNATYTFIPQEEGIFDFHDHLNPKKIGVLIINN